MQDYPKIKWGFAGLLIVLGFLEFFNFGTPATAFHHVTGLSNIAIALIVLTAPSEIKQLSRSLGLWVLMIYVAGMLSGYGLALAFALPK